MLPCDRNFERQKYEEYILEKKHLISLDISDCSSINYLYLSPKKQSGIKTAQCPVTLIRKKKKISFVSLLCKLHLQIFQLPEDRATELVIGSRNKLKIIDIRKRCGVASGNAQRDAAVYWSGYNGKISAIPLRRCPYVSLANTLVQDCIVPNVRGSPRV